MTTVTVPSAEELSEIVSVGETDDTTENVWLCVVHNDDYTTFPYVIFTFKKVLKITADKAEMLTREIHRMGKAVVADGEKGEMETICRELTVRALRAEVTQ